MCAKKKAIREADEEGQTMNEEQHDHDHEHEEGEEEVELSEEEKKQKALESYQKAGKVAKEALDKACNMAQVGTKVIDICTEIEAFIVEQGASVGFPVNVGINNVAAHYTSGPQDFTVIEEGDVVKLDLGVHVDGYIADTARTVNLSTKPELENIVQASEESLQAALDMLKVGAKTNDLGKRINEVIKQYKYQPVKDLSGHTVEQWTVHGGKQVPLVPQTTGDEIAEGDVFAIETFSSTGEGQTHALPSGNIYQLLLRNVPKIRNQAAKQMIGFIAKEYKTLPFSHRAWAKEMLVPKFALNELINTGVLLEYRVLADIKGSYVSQAEKTVYVHEDSIEILS